MTYTSSTEIDHIGFSQYDGEHEILVHKGIWKYEHSYLGMKFMLHGMDMDEKNMHIVKSPNTYNPARVFSIWVGEWFTYDEPYGALRECPITIGKDEKGEIIYLCIDFT